MDFQIIRGERLPLDASKFVNGLLGHKGTMFTRSRPLDPVTEVVPAAAPTGGWIVQKFGGTSVGKFPIKIAEDIIL